MTETYDTPLTADEQKAYNAWGLAQQQKTGRNPTADTGDYDMQGFFKENGPVDLTAGAHFTDTFKKPNHPTFSTESQYSGDGNQAGGTWTQVQGSYVFTPGPVNYKHHTVKDLNAYFNAREPDAKLDIKEPARSVFNNSKMN